MIAGLGNANIDAYFNAAKSKTGSVCIVLGPAFVQGKEITAEVLTGQIFKKPIEDVKVAVQTVTSGNIVTAVAAPILMPLKALGGLF